jgi:hypothetical protein
MLVRRPRGLRVLGNSASFAPRRPLVARLQASSLIVVLLPITAMLLHLFESSGCNCLPVEEPYRNMFFAPHSVAMAGEDEDNPYDDVEVAYGQVAVNGQTVQTLAELSGEVAAGKVGSRPVLDSLRQLKARRAQLGVHGARGDAVDVRMEQDVPVAALKAVLVSIHEDGQVAHLLTYR